MESPISAEKPHQILFVSLGMVVIDELRFPGQQPLIDVLGGSGAYSTLGARLFSSECPKCVGCLVLAGNDFPRAVEDRLRDWDISLTIRKEARSSTRGLLEYEDSTFGPKKFRYVTNPLKTMPADVRETILLQAPAFHLLATPEEVMKQVPELLALRAEQGITDRPLILWEPFPAACKSENRESTMKACKLVDVFSPNHLEMTALFSQKPPSKTLQRAQLEGYANSFLDSTVGPLGQGYVVVRAAEHGCLVACRSAFTWFPAFYAPGSPEVKDPTGAGNAFLGGFAVGILKCGDVTGAASYGSVAASFALEQIGLPCREDGGGETWNGHSVQSRLEEYCARLRGGEGKASCN